MLTADGSQVIGMGYKQGIAIWDANSGKLLSQLPVGEEGRPTKIAPDGKLVFVVRTKKSTINPDLTGVRPEDMSAAFHKHAAFDQAELTLVDPKTGNIVRRLRDHQSRFREAYFSNDGKFIVTTSDDGLVRCESIATGEVAVSYGTGGKPDTVEFSPDGKSLFVVPRNGSPLILPIDGSNKPTPFAGKWGEIYDGAFSPASGNIMALHTDTGFHVMDRKTDKPTLSITGLQETDSQMRFSSDGNFLMLSLDGGNRFVVCEVTSGRPLYELYGGDRMGSSRYAYSETGGIISASFTTDALKVWETSKIPTTVSPDAKTFGTAAGAYRFTREPQADGSIVIKVKPRE